MVKKQDKIDYRIVCVGLICLTVLEIVALMNGINGTLLKTVLIAIALTIGITIPNPMMKK